MGTATQRWARGLVPFVGALWAKAALALASLGLEPAMSSWEWATLDNAANALIVAAVTVGLFLWRREKREVRAWILASWALVMAVVALGLWVTWLGEDFGFWPLYDFRLTGTLDDLATISLFAAIGVGVLSVASTAWSGSARRAGRGLTLGMALVALYVVARFAATTASKAFHGDMAKALEVLGALLLAGGMIALAVSVTRIIREGDLHREIVDAF